MKLKSILLSAVATLGLTAATMAQNVPSYVPTNGLVGWWPFNGNANDESSNGNNGIVNGATLTLDRLNSSNSAYSFNGSNNNIIISDNNMLTFGNNSFTISFWVRLENQTASNPMIFKRGLNSTGPWEYGVGYGNQFYLHGWNSSGTCGRFPVNSTYQFQNQVWKHIVYVVDVINNQGFIYVDNVLQATISINSSCEMVNTTAPLIFGNGGQWGEQHWLNGVLDDIGIWNRALTTQEVTDLYNSSSCSNDLVITPQNNTSQTSGSVSFTATTSDPNPSLNWQIDFGQGFQTLNNFGNYSGVNTNTLTINNLQLANHLQQIRAISTSGNCIDTSNVATITLTDTCINYITVTDTLIINTTLSVLSPPNNVNTIIVYPNPASTHITIDYGDYTLMNGYTLQIVNTLGQTMYTTPINQQSSYIDLSTWTGNGLYFVQIIDPQNNTIENRKIVIQ